MNNVTKIETVINGKSVVLTRTSSGQLVLRVGGQVYKVAEGVTIRHGQLVK